MKTLGLSIPERTKRTKRSFDVRSKKVEEWIAGLPKANVGETARKVFSALVEANHLHIPHQDRARFLEIMRTPVKYVTDYMKKYFVCVPFPLPEKGQKVAAITREIYAEMATSYKIAIEDMVSHDPLFPDNKLLTILIHRAVSSLSRELLTSFQVYAPFQYEIWTELHKLYAYAEERKFHRTAVTDAHHQHVIKTTVSDEYKRILLLSLTSPYSLRHGEINKIYDTLERWSGHTELYHMDNKDQLEGFFAVNLQGNEPPRYLAMNNRQNFNASTSRTLNTDMLTDSIRVEIQHAKDIGSTTLAGIDAHRPDLSHDLLRRLLTAWGTVPKRVFSRSRTDRQVEVGIGLSAIHYITRNSDKQDNRLNGTKQTAKDQYIKQSHFESITVTDINEKQPDVWNMVYPDKDLIEELENSDKPPEKDTRKFSQYHPKTWTIVNESAGGYCLKGRKDGQTKVQVGELICIHRNRIDHVLKWGIGAIRWMKFNGGNSLVLAIEMLTPEATAIGIRFVASDINDNNYQRALLLPEMTAINQAATLITPPVPYRVGNKIVIKGLGREMPVELTKLIANTGLYAQFQFQRLDKVQGPSVSSETWLELKEFGNIWSTI